jgi:hypothetical protein
MPDTAIGRPIPREATRRLVHGGGRYLDDHAERGELHAGKRAKLRGAQGFRLCRGERRDLVRG